MRIRMSHPSFQPTFQPIFLSTSHAQETSLSGALIGSLTIIRPILAEAFHNLVKTRCGLVLTSQCGFCTAWSKNKKRKEENAALYYHAHL